jgi:hypothetical protein
VTISAAYLDRISPTLPDPTAVQAEQKRPHRTALLSAPGAVVPLQGQ